MHGHYKWKTGDQQAVVNRYCAVYPAKAVHPAPSPWWDMELETVTRISGMVRY